MRLRRKYLHLLYAAGAWSLISFLLWTGYMPMLDMLEKTDFNVCGARSLPNRCGTDQVKDTCHSVPRTCVTADWTVTEIIDEISFSVDKNSHFNLLQYQTNQKNTPCADTKSHHTQVIVVPYLVFEAELPAQFDKLNDLKISNNLSSVIQSLQTNPDLKLSWSYAMSLQSWWAEQSKETRTRFQRLVHNGQIEIVAGAWAPSDEAITHYYSAIDQLVDDHTWVKDNLGTIPENGWLSDRVSGTLTLSHIWQKAGIRNMIIAGDHGPVKMFMEQKSLIKFRLRQFWDPEGFNDVTTLLEYFTKCKPRDTSCAALNMSMSIPLLERAEVISNKIQEKGKLYVDRIIMMPVGIQSQYTSDGELDMQMGNLVDLVKVFTSHNRFNITMSFGTVKEYFALVHDEQNGHYKNFPVLSGDFSSYLHEKGFQRSGYTSLGIVYKRLHKELFNNIRAGEIMMSLVIARALQHGKGFSELSSVLSSLLFCRRMYSWFQHYITVSTTSNFRNISAAGKQLHNALPTCRRILSGAIERLLDLPIYTLKPIHTSYSSSTRRPVLRMSSSSKHIVLVNSLTKARNEVISLLIDTQKISVTDDNGQNVACQINRLWDIKSKVGSVTFEMFFEVTLPPLSISVYIVSKGRHAAACSIGVEHETVTNEKEYMTLQNEFIEVKFNNKTGVIRQICDGIECTLLNQDWMLYRTSRKSVFRPVTTATSVLRRPPTIRVIRGELVSRVHVIHSYFQQIVTVYNTNSIASRTVHIQTISQPATDDDTELIMRFYTDILNSRTFFTDASAFQMVGRKTRNHLPIENNYYSALSLSFLEDSQKRFSLHFDQPQRVASLGEGWLEVIIERGRANDRPAVSNFVIQIEYKHRVSNYPEREPVVFPSMDSVILDDLMQSPVLVFSSETDDIRHSRRRVELLSYPLPCDIIIANVRPLSGTSSVVDTGLTLHRRAVSCDFIPLHTGSNCTFYRPVQIPIGQLFEGIEPVQVQKVSLTFLHGYNFIGSNAALVELSPMELLSLRIRWVRN